MHLEVTFRNMRAREEIRRRANALYAKLERFLDPASEATCEVTHEHGSTTVELTVSVRGKVFQASDEDEDLRTSLDRSFHKLETALRRAKERRQDRWRKNTEPRADGFVPAGDDDDDEDLEQPAM